MSIDTRINYDDILWLIAAADAWEEKESSEFYMAKEILSIPEFEEDHPAYEFIKALKRKYRGTEQQLADKKDAVSEHASTMKAKLYWIKKELGIEGLLNVPTGIKEQRSGNIKEQRSGNGVSPTEPEKPQSTYKPEAPPSGPLEGMFRLKAELAEAIRKEDYARAAELRDAINEKSGGSQE